ncbi:MAG: hypothetical protein ACLP9K_04170 [Nitrososphaerales archaeon]
MKRELEELGFTDVVRLEHNHTCDFRAKLLGVDSMIEVRGRSKGATQIIMTISKYERMEELGRIFLVFLYVFNEEGRKALIGFPGELPAPFRLIVQGVPVGPEPKSVCLDDLRLELLEQVVLDDRVCKVYVER